MMRQIELISLLLSALLLSCLPQKALADITMPSLLAEHMVIQRNEPVRVWGKANPGEFVSVRFRDQMRNTSANALGKWQVTLPPGTAGGPFELDIVGANTIRFYDILVGDVWLASGQSNMELRLRDTANAKTVIATAGVPGVRLFQVEDNSSNYALDDVHAKTWAPCSPDTAAGFSAVAYYFARKIAEDQKVPVGMIESDWGGTPAEAWTSMRALSEDASLMPVFANFADLTNGWSDRLLDQTREDREYETAKANGKSKGERPWHPELRSLEPAGLYNAMIAPLTNFPIRGVIWYQGEGNTGAGQAPYYSRLFPALIQDWRQRWNEGDIPFLFVQISSYGAPDRALWSTVRDAQRRTLSLRNTGMVVTIDVGDALNIHPTDKQTVGNRLALTARAIAYNESLEYSGPLYREIMREGDQIRVFFDHISGGLVAKHGNLRGFEIAGADRKFMRAKARIDGQSVLVSSDDVRNPVYIRYGWANNPDCNLFNGDGLPASPFTSEP